MDDCPRRHRHGEEDLQLALGESAANAVEHAYGPDEQGEFAFTLSRRVDGSAIDVEVTDFGRWRAPPAHPGFRAVGSTSSVPSRSP